MGLMRRDGSRVEDPVGVGAGRTAPRVSAGARSDKESKLYVQPAELARKLVKELEDHKVSRPTGALACNHYTVFLCPEDYRRLRAREDEIVASLERHLDKHIQAKKYETPGDVVVAIEVDPDLETGYFGIFAERVGPAPIERKEPATSVMAAAPSAAVIMPRKSAPAATSRPSTAITRPAPAGSASTGGTTMVVRPEEAAQLDLARHVMVLKVGNRVREFTQGRIIVGRGRDVDFRVDDPNVSRRHAAVYWEDGDMMVEDLDSTNGTLLNGYPVTNAVLHPGDVLAMGDCRITVETR